MNSVEDVLVVGAGPAGLAVARELTRAGLRPRVVDGAARVAQPWRDRHDMLHLNTHSRFSALPGLRFPRAAGAFPYRDDVVRYLEDYARRLPVDIDWGVAVNRVDPQDGHWVARSGAGDLAARDIVLATGPDHVPVRPRWPGEAEFRGEVRHAADVRRPRDLAGRRVLIVGGGNSGVDLAGALLRVGVGKLWVSVRHGVTIIPRRLGPVPVHPLGVFARGAPVRVQDLTVGLTSRLAFGDLGRLGYPPPQQGAASLFAARGISPAADDGFVAALRRGAAAVVGPVTRFARDGVVLADGQRLDSDVVVCATGYRPGLEPLVGHLDVLDDRGRPVAVPGPVDGWPGLWFAGQRPPFHGNLYERGPEARRLAARLHRRRSGRVGQVVGGRRAARDADLPAGSVRT
jgi:cation diffusion facilitator CzcD-associated flavoprotein CzcO